jgi:hypothetical protein
MLEKLVLAGAVTFSVYIFSGVELPATLRLPFASRAGETVTQTEKETRQENTDKAVPWKSLANNFVNQ